jgi:hypothetical protein
MLRAAALALARRHLAVFPCRPRDKRPATVNGAKDATTDPEQIERWWRVNAELNVAIATGPASGMFVVDVDGHGAELELRKLETAHGALPPTVETITSRGRHLFSRLPSDADIRNSAGKVAPRIDVRGNGGYVLAPPSMHPSGRRYCWSVDSASAIAAAPIWLLGEVVTPVGADAAAVPASEWRALVQGVAEGARDNSLARLAGHLLRHRIDPHVVLELLLSFNETRCAPPLPAGDVMRIVNSIARRELQRRAANGG